MCARKFGRPFNEIDHLANASLCSHKIGQVQVDCKFRLSQSRWGVLGDNKTPAGILYMDLTFDQPRNCQLTNATVSITLTDEDPELAGKQKKKCEKEERQVKRRQRKDKLAERNGVAVIYRAPARSLQMTDYYGPKRLVGEPASVASKDAWHLTPEVNVAGNGVGGIGYDQEKTVTYTDRWTFTGTLLPGKEPRSSRTTTFAAYRTLKWELTENELQSRAMHNNVIQTAFAFEHDIKPFYIRVEIEGKLQKRSAQLKENMKRLMKFPSESKKDQGTSWTLVHLDKDYKVHNSTRRLDQIAQGLPLNMERVNHERTPVQLPDSLPVSFHEVPHGPENLSTSSTLDNDLSGTIPTIDQMKSTTLENSPLLNIPPASSPLYDDSGPLQRPTQSDRTKGSRIASLQAHKYTERGVVPDKAEVNIPGNTQRSSKNLTLAQKRQMEGQTTTENTQELASQLAKSPAMLVFLRWFIYIITLFPTKGSRASIDKPEPEQQ